MMPSHFVPKMTSLGFKKFTIMCFILIVCLFGFTYADSNSPSRILHPVNHPQRENPFYLDSALGDIQWASKDVLFVLSFDGRCYRSRNGGRSWEDQQANMRNTGHRIRQIRVSPADHKSIFFLGEHGNHIATTDMGDTYFPVNFPLVEIRMHPRESHWLLSSVMTPACGRPVHATDSSRPETMMEKMNTDCYKQLYWSKDFGRSWTHLYDYVVQYDWAAVSSYIPVAKGKKPSIVPTIYATVHSDQTGTQVFGKWNPDVNFVISHDLFKTEPIVLAPHGNRFLFGDNNYLFVAAVDPEDKASVELLIAKTNGVPLSRESFKSAMLPVALTEHSYTILDASENSVFLHVNHKPFRENAYAGHIYISDSTGSQYSLALPFNHRNAAGKCDFTKLEGIEGIFLANFVDEIEMTEATHVQDHTSEMQRHISETGSGGSRNTAPLRVKTVVTFNKGAEWNYLTAPAVDADGNPYKCAVDGMCHLHLHGVTHGFGPFYSVASATGIIMATGTVGNFLNSVPGLINTYFSNDGGLTWAEVAKGSHIYEIADHGGLIVMASDQSPTTTLYYSWDQARTWAEYVFSDVEIMVENIITEPSSTTQHFLVYGTSASSDHNTGAGVVVFVDFSVLHQRQCEGIDAAGVQHSDYELWSPNDGRNNGKCLMGHTVTYVRRKALSQCSSPALLNKPTFVTNCACTIHDFECDVGYMRESPDGPCIPDSSADAIAKDSAAQAHAKCRNQPHYRVTKGYRKIPGNTCIGGHEWEALIAPCPSGWLSSSSYPATMLIFVFLIAIVVIVAAKTEWADQYINTIKHKFKFAHGYFQVGAPGSAPNSMYDEGPSNMDNLGYDESGKDDLNLDSDSDTTALISTAHVHKNKGANQYRAPQSISAPPALQPPTADLE